MAPVDKMHTPPLDTGGILTRIALTAWKTSDGTGISGPFFRHAGFHKKKVSCCSNTLCGYSVVCLTRWSSNICGRNIKTCWGAVLPLLTGDRWQTDCGFNHDCNTSCRIPAFKVGDGRMSIIPYVGLVSMIYLQKYIWHVWPEDQHAHFWMVDLWKVTSNHWAMGIAGYALEVGAGAVNGGSSHLPAERSQDGFFRSENRSGFWPGEKNILIIPMGNMWESSEAACAAGILGMAPTGYLVVGVPAMAAKLRDVSYFWLNNPSYLATFRLLNQGPFFLWRLDETCWWRRIGCWGHKKDISGTPYHCRKNLLFPTNFLQIFLTNPVMVRPGDQLRPGRIHRRHCAPAVGCWANSGERPPRLALAGWESEGAHRHGGPLALFFAHVFHENLRNCEYLSKNLWMCNCSYTPPHTHVYI